MSFIEPILGNNPGLLNLATSVIIGALAVAAKFLGCSGMSI